MILSDRGEKKLTEYFDEKQEKKGYSRKLFGEKAKIKVDFNKGKVRKLRLSLKKVDYNAIVSAISEQIGKEGEEKGNDTEWMLETCNIKLLEGNDNYLIDITINEKPR